MRSTISFGPRFGPDSNRRTSWSPPESSSLTWDPPTATARIFCSASFDIGRSRPSLRSCSHQLGKAITHALDLGLVHVQLIVAGPPRLLHLSHEHKTLQVQHEVVELAEAVHQSASAVARG